jgi:phenylalanyl-tRNA synthetase alpha chain
MNDTNELIKKARQRLKSDFDNLDDKSSILRSKELKELYGKIKNLDEQDRANFGQAVNNLKSEVSSWLKKWQDNLSAEQKSIIDITAPFDENTPLSDKPEIFGPSVGSSHPVLEELVRIGDIFKRMGFSIEESRQLDDEYHMFDSKRSSCSR